MRLCHNETSKLKGWGPLDVGITSEGTEGILSKGLSGLLTTLQWCQLNGKEGGVGID